MADEEFLDKKLQERKDQHAFRLLRLSEGALDFCSNDYLGIATGGLIEAAWKDGGQTFSALGKKDRSAKTGNLRDGSTQPATEQALRHGSAGSRLLSGNYPLIEETEAYIASFHQAEAGLIFNSGYDANLGLLSCIPQRGDTILYDQLCHASIRDGMRLSFAHSFSFAHNDVPALEQRLRGARGELARGNLFVVTESVFSMDGDQAPLAAIAVLCRRYGAHLIVDEAHATGIVGAKGQGLVHKLGLQKECLARVHTFGKAVGCHGAIVLGSRTLRDYLINFSRSLIYTTALPETSVQAIRIAYSIFPGMDRERDHLQSLIDRFQQASLAWTKLPSRTPIQIVIVPGNEAVRDLAAKLQSAHLDVRPIRYPTVPRGSERLRIVLHSFNMREEIDRLIGLLQ